MFFLSSFSHNCDDQLMPNCHRLVMLCLYDGIQQVWTLVFDNYQRCTVPLNTPITSGTNLNWWSWTWLAGHVLVNVNDHYSHLVYPHICIKIRTCDIFDSIIGHRSCMRITKEKNTINALHNTMLLAWSLLMEKLTSFSRTTLLQREAFLTMSYTINIHCSSPSKFVCQQLFL